MADFKAKDRRSFVLRVKEYLGKAEKILGPIDRKLGSNVPEAMHVLEGLVKPFRKS